MWSFSWWQSWESRVTKGLAWAGQPTPPGSSCLMAGSMRIISYAWVTNVLNRSTPGLRFWTQTELTCLGSKWKIEKPKSSRQIKTHSNPNWQLQGWTTKSWTKGKGSTESRTRKLEQLLPFEHDLLPETISSSWRRRTRGGRTSRKYERNSKLLSAHSSQISSLPRRNSREVPHIFLTTIWQVISWIFSLNRSR